MENSAKQTPNGAIFDQSVPAFTPGNSFGSNGQRQPWSKPEIRIEPVSATAAGHGNIPDAGGSRTLKS